MNSISKKRVILASALLLTLLLAGRYGPASAGEYNNMVRADYVLVEKAGRRMVLYRDGHIIRIYRISIGRGGTAPKLREGDMLTPEGLYYINGRNPESRFHLSLHISYPDPEDVIRATLDGVAPGSHIMIHGVGRESVRAQNVAFTSGGDWTAGCIAVTNREIEEIWHMVPDGTPVEIRR